MPKRAFLQIGQDILFHGEPGEIVNVSDEHVVIVSGSTTRRFTRPVFDQLRIKCSIVYVPAGTQAAAPKEDSELSYLNERQLACLKRKQQYVLALEAEPANRCARRTLARVINTVTEEIGDPHPPGPTTLHDWYKRYRNAGSSSLGLIDRVKRRGNSKSRLTKAAHTLIDESIEKDFLLRTRPTREHAYTNGLLRRCEAAGVPAPSYKTYCVRIRELDSAYITRRREGVAAERRQTRVNRGGLTSTRILERVELDGSLLDLVVLTDCREMILGRPYLIILRDHYSGSVLGFNVQYGAGESAIASIKALECAIHPKTAFHEQFPRLKNYWRMHGLPELLVMDASRGFQSTDMQEFCATIGLPVMTTTTRMPWLKGTVESAFNAINTALHPMPGAVLKANPKAAEKHDAHKYAAISRSEFMEILTTWIVDVVNQKPKKSDKDPRRVGFSPDELWQASAKTVPPMELTGVPDFSHFGVKRLDRQIQEGAGVRAFNLYWDSDDLQRLRRRLPEKTQVKLRINPDDLGRAWVEDPIEQRLIQVEGCTRGYMSGLSLVQHKIVMRHVRMRYLGNAKWSNVIAVRRELEERAEEARAKLRRMAKASGRPQKLSKGTTLSLDRHVTDGYPDDQDLHDILRRSMPTAGSSPIPDVDTFRRSENEQPAPPDCSQFLDSELDENDDFEITE